MDSGAGVADGAGERRAGRVLVGLGFSVVDVRGASGVGVPVVGAREVVGALGDRLKIKVAAPPEDGRANAGVCALLAERLGVGRRAVEVVSGMTNPEKVVRVEGVDAATARRLLLGE